MGKLIDLAIKAVEPVLKFVHRHVTAYKDLKEDIQKAQITYYGGRDEQL